MKSIIIGAGSDLGVHIDGSSLGPVQLINDIKSFYNGETTTIMQEEDILKSRNLSDRRKNEYEVDEINTKIYNTILEKEKDNYFPIVIGGDSSITIPTALASSKVRENIGMILFSPYTNYNTFDTTVSGNINGMALAAINGYKNSELRYYHDGNVIQPTKTVVVGARSIDDWEKDNVKYSGLNVFTSEDIKQKGLETVINEAFSIANERTKGVHISFDLGLLDPSIAPGVSIPEFDGVSEEEVMNINKLIIAHMKDITSYDLVEFNPLRDENRKTEQIALNILAQIINAVNKKNENEFEVKLK
ncbi:arginase [Mycoplasma sp. CAG:877]|nr:arginase [Mycoplasma sp. CAG:877]